MNSHQRGTRDKNQSSFLMTMANSLERELVLKEMMRPRVCYLTKGEHGYGFHLHGERNKGAQYIRKIEPGSPADLSGLRSGDRVVEVNGENVERDPHHVVVQKIRAVEHRTRLLVVDRETDDYLRHMGLPCTEDRAVEIGSLSPRTSTTSSPRTSATSSPRASATPSPCASFTRPHMTVSPIKTKQATPTSVIEDPSRTHNGEKESPSATPNGSIVHQCHARLMTSPVAMMPVVEHSPEDEGGSDTSASGSSPLPSLDLRPRLCHLRKNEQGYGFNLHSDKARSGQFIRCVDPDSPAQHAGLRPKDRLVEVNGMNIEHLRHSEVVAVIRRGGGETSLLVVDPETDELFKRLGITPTNKHLEEDCVDGPVITETESSSVVESLVPDSSISAPSHTHEDRPVPPPVINVMIMDPPTTKSPSPCDESPSAYHLSKSSSSPRHVSQDSSSSHSTISELSAELSSSDNSTKVVDEEDQSSTDPFWQMGLHLSPTAAEAKQRAQAKRSRKKAPPMDWSKKQQLFSNF